MDIMLDGTLDAVRANSQDGMVKAKVQNLERSVEQGDIKKASENFEAYFLSYLLKVMRATVPKSGLLENKMGEVYHSFYDEEIARRTAESGGIGLGQLMLSSLAKDANNPNKDEKTTSDPS